MVSRTSAIAAGVCGALFIGYCIYFDRKRRNDPNFKNRLRERRKKQKVAKERASISKLPDLKDAEAVQKFFLEEIQLGEELLGQGKFLFGYFLGPIYAFNFLLPQSFLVVLYLDKIYAKQERSDLASDG
ncbi:mitochondrial import receptor subunit TOM20 homolog [Protopterus annectens]|uniref:mitochondrial import receptor subunit TOM20 homolog n=1 Tax=Protopterus annectens TaxID=7888 RepID=UPI001CFB4300|nr:mitochondrial import receptor subunit TOM20 homolog [Protopterus annectens]